MIGETLSPNSETLSPNVVLIANKKKQHRCRITGSGVCFSCRKTIVKSKAQSFFFQCCS